MSKSEDIPQDELTPDDQEEVRRESAPVGLTQAEIEAIFDTYPQYEADALRAVLADYRTGKFTNDKRKMLTDAGIITGPVKAAKAHTELDNDICESQEELRNRIMIHFQNPDKTSKLRREISKSEMSQWTKSKNLHGVPPPPKAIEGVKRRWSLRAWIEWFEKYMLWSDEFRPEDSNGDGRKDSRVMPMGELEQVTKREQMEHDRFKIQEEMGRFLAVTVAARIAGGLINQYHNLWKSWVEKRMVDEREADLQSLNIEPEKISVAKDRDIVRAQNFVDSVESASEKFASELDEKLKAEIKKENDRRA